MSLPHLVLGILKYGPMSGYDLNKAFQASVQHFWNTEQSQIYRALYRLREDGWVAVEVVPQENAPNKKLYRLTDSGRAELHRWLAQPQPAPALHEGWIGQLFFAAELDQAELAHLLTARIAALRAVLAVFDQTLPGNAAEYGRLYNAAADVPYWQWTIDYGRRKAQFDLEWALETVARLHREDN